MSSFRNHKIQLPFGTRAECAQLAMDLIAADFTFKFQERYPQFIVRVSSIDSLSEHEFESIVTKHRAFSAVWDSPVKL